MQKSSKWSEIALPALLPISRVAAYRPHDSSTLLRQLASGTVPAADARQGWQGRRGARGAGRRKRAPRRNGAGRGVPKSSAPEEGRGALVSAP